MGKGKGQRGKRPAQSPKSKSNLTPQKVKIPGSGVPSAIYMAFGLVAILAIIMISRAWYYSKDNPKDLGITEQRELAVAYCEDMAQALETWREQDGEGQRYPEDPVDVYQYMMKRPVNPFSGFWARGVYFSPREEAKVVEPPVDPGESESAAPTEENSTAGDYIYWPVAAYVSGASEPVERGGFYLLAMADEEFAGADLNCDGLPDGIIGIWVSADALAGEVALTPLKDVLETEVIACGAEPPAAEGDAVQELINRFYKLTITKD